eukprot:4147114-Alexandrium_andersonii.AAC.1
MQYSRAEVSVKCNLALGGLMPGPKEVPQCQDLLLRNPAGDGGLLSPPKDFCVLHWLNSCFLGTPRSGYLEYSS